MGRARENKGRGMSKGAKACHNMANLVKIQHVKAEYKKGKVGADTKRPKLKSCCKEPHILMKKFGP